MEKTYTFNDVLIKPQYSEIESRKNVDTSVKVHNLKVNIPVVSANMKTITGPDMSKEMIRKGAWSILHRFGSIENAVQDYIECTTSGYTPGVSIGVNDGSKERFQALYKEGARIFCVDVAHGHHVLVKKTIEWIKSEQSDVYVIGGNIATGEAAFDLTHWGADALKVGIGPGSMCQTRTNTGVGIPQLYALKAVYEVANYDCVKKKCCGFKAPLIIADGGVKTIGDIAKALKYSDMVMLGSFFAGCMETPGDVFKDKTGQRYKVYGGSASAENKHSSGQKVEFVEGVTEKVPLGDHVKHLVREIHQGLQSAFSYVGANNMEEYHEKCKFVEMTPAGVSESKL